MHIRAFFVMLPLLMAQTDINTAAALQHPNATGSVSLLGVNMIDDPSTTLESVAWSADINVTSITNASSTLTSTAISLDAHGTFVEDSLWDTCVVIMYGLARNATVKGQGDAGSCEETLGATCVQDWEEAVVDARLDAGVQSNASTGYPTCGGMVLPAVPASCAGSFDLRATLRTIQYTNETDGSAFYSVQDGPHDSSNTTYYEVAATQIWPIMLIQTPGQRPNSSSHTGFSSGKLSCLRATNVTAGSVAIGDVPGAGSKMGATVWGLGAAMVVAVMLM